MKVCRILLVLIMVVRVTGSAKGQTPYKLPPRDVVAMIDAPQPPIPVLSPTRDSMLLVDVQYYPPIATLAEPVLRVAGVRINPRVGCTQRRVLHTGLTIKPLDNSPARRIEIPEKASIGLSSWSHDGKKIAFARDVDDGVELWIGRRGDRPSESNRRRSPERCARQSHDLALR